MNEIEKSNRRVEMSAVLSDAVYKYEVSIVFKLARSQRQLKLYKLLPILFVMVIGCLGFYIFTDNGTEASILIVNSILFLGFFTVILGMLPLRESYEKQEIISKK